MSETPRTPVLEYAPANEAPRPWGKGFLAFAASWWLPGLGHLIVGRWRRAVFWLVLFAGGELACLAIIIHPRLLLVAGAVAIIEVGLRVWLSVDAFFCARWSGKRLLGAAWLRYAAGIACLAASQVVFLQPSAAMAFYLRAHYVEAFSLSSNSMSPTLVPGDKFLLHKQVGWRRWSLVVVNHPQYGPGVAIAKRVVGLPGETVEIVNGRLHIDGKPVTPPPGVTGYVNAAYIGRIDPSLEGKPGAGCEGNPIHLGPDEYFVLGDNSPVALDARLWEIPAGNHQLGALPAGNIKGRITAIYWPPSRWRLFSE